ncbi:aldo/keto reductase [Weissella paramesenteroides]
MSRENLFVITKIQVEFKDYQTAKKSIDESLQRLNLNYLDLLLIHSLEPWVEFHNKENHYFEENIEVWCAMEEAVNNGKVRSIGVSNFTPILVFGT